MRRPAVRVVLTVVYTLLALNAWIQVALVPLGRSGDPIALTALQALVGAAGASAAWGSWRLTPWAPVAALSHGAVTAGMLLALVPLLDLEAGARGGLAVGAGGLLLFALASAWYLRRALSRAAAPPRGPGPHAPAG